jgi:hypothetical protein
MLQFSLFHKLFPFEPAFLGFCIESLGYSGGATSDPKFNHCNRVFIITALNPQNITNIQ